uniref:SpoU_methylase domain-containing protein n=1 Tax=Macrostomum lignano TaxID=282301 RepID=A0A1I8GM20_9PLAT
EVLVGLSVRRGCRGWSPGYQPELVCLLGSTNPDAPPPPVTCARFSPDYQILAIGNENGVGLVDLVQACVLLTLCTPDLYGTCAIACKSYAHMNSASLESFTSSELHFVQDPWAGYFNP